MKYLYLFVLCVLSFTRFVDAATAEVEGFVAGTLVKIPDGYAPIESIHAGDAVVSCDFENHCVSRTVNQVRKIVTDKYMTITVDGEIIGIGYNHRLFSADTDFWANASQVAVSSTLINSAGEHLKVSSVRMINESVTLYGLSVEQFQNYYVSKVDVLVHNYTMAELDAILDRLSPREQAQVLIMEEFENIGGHSPMQLSYILATAEFETMYFKSMKEIGGEKMKYAPYYGRGYVQLTHDFNYEKFGKILNLPLLQNPDLAMDKRIAAKIIVYGMMHGVFTGNLKKDGIHWSGKKLVDFFNGNGDGTGKADWYNARTIINGHNKAPVVADLGKKWFYYFKNSRGKPNGDIKFLAWMPWHEDL